MPKENEKKFLLRENKINYATSQFLWMHHSVDGLAKKVMKDGTPYEQGYLDKETGLEVATILGLENCGFNPIEFRLRQEGSIYVFTMKGDGSAVRDETPKHEIPKGFFKLYWGRTIGKRVSKTRLSSAYDPFIVEYDIYRDRDLFVAEIEVSSERILDTVPVLGKDITTNNEYKNKNLAK